MEIDMDRILSVGNKIELSKIKKNKDDNNS